MVAVGAPRRSCQGTTTDEVGAPGRTYQGTTTVAVGAPRRSWWGHQNGRVRAPQRTRNGCLWIALDKPAYEKGESLGRATTAIASEVAIDVVTDGLGTVATLRKVEKAAEAADHVRDAERVATAAAKERGARFVSGSTVIDRRTGAVLEGTVDLKPTLDRIETGGRFPHRNDGAVFQNRPLPGRDAPSLPNQSPGYYREYVHPTPGTPGPGPQRVVVGRGGEMYYTPDHYQTFVPLK
jgi:guanyl-specific ribonuclease Sa